jgi:hypothetical protein
MTFFSEASANSSVTARFKNRQAQTVTSTATATASSEISQDDTHRIANKLAKNIANSQAQHNAEILVQSVDTATEGETIFYLGSSLLKDYVREEDDNVTHTLIKDFTLPDGMILNIQDGKTLNISKNVTLTINKKNEAHIYGTLNSNGNIVVDGGSLVNHSKNTLILYDDSITYVTNGTLVNTDDGTMLVTANSQISLSDSSRFTNDIGCTCTIENGSIIYIPSSDKTVNVIYNHGTINISDVIDTNYPYGEIVINTSNLNVTYYSILNNDGIINVGLGNGSSSNANAELIFSGYYNVNAGIINFCKG